MRWSSRFVAQPSAEEVVALLRSVHKITAETQGKAKQQINSFLDSLRGAGRLKPGRLLFGGELDLVTGRKVPKTAIAVSR